jgi:sigma-B regulation protein RsbU (phosphoserine phosphatase)
MLFGRGPAKVEHRVCAARGEAPYCEYKISWRSGIRPDWLLTALGSAAGLITYAISGYPGQLHMDLGLLLQPVLGAGTGFVIGHFLQDRKRKTESAEMMRKQNALLMKTNEQLISDLETAYQVQRTLLPSHNPEIKGLDVAGRLFYARRIGGDFYDFIPKGEQLGVCVADVCGKGVQAALFTSVLKNALWQGMYSSNRPKKLLAYVDHQVNHQLPDEMFITMGCAVVDTSRDKIVIGSAGHEPPILYKTNERKASVLGIKGLALGLRHLASLDPDMQDEEEHEFTEGDVMMFYTDGALAHVSDQDAAREELARLLETKVHLPAEEIVNEIFSGLMERSSASKRDDLTIVVIKRVPGC